MDKSDWRVVIGVDISGSTRSFTRLEREKRSVHYIGELLNRLGIPFAVIAHTGERERGQNWMKKAYVKKFEQPWDSSSKQRLFNLDSSTVNYDGHALELFRREITSRRAKDYLIIYHTDGAMPQENYQEELAVLKRELKTCEDNNVTVVGVGIDTDSPTKHGLSTVVFRNDSDIIAVIEHIANALSA